MAPNPSINNYGAGNPNANTGSGTQINNTGSGQQFTGSVQNVSNAMHFYGSMGILDEAERLRREREG